MRVQRITTSENLAMKFRSLLNEPFVHFLVLGGLVFGAFSLWGASRDGIDRDVVVTSADVARLEALWQTQYSRPPTGEELSAIIDNHIKEEVLYREAMALGLSDDDIIVRRRLVQKFLFLSEDLIQIAEPSDELLTSYYEAHRDRYLVSPQTSFRHVYLSAEKRGEMARGDAAVLVGRLQKGDDNWRELGDPFMLQREYAARKETEIAELFGTGFAGALQDVEAGKWTGPVRSAYGWHGVKILDRAPQTLPPLAEIRSEVTADYSGEQRRKANKEFYQAVRDRYTVVIEPDAKTADRSPG